MGTRASIVILDEHHVFHIYRGHDGYPEAVMPDLQAVCELLNSPARRIGEAGQAVAMFFAHTGDVTKRLLEYDMTTGRHGDEEYDYVIGWDKNNREWYAHCKQESPTKEQDDEDYSR